MIDAHQKTPEDLKMISGDEMMQWKSVLLMASSNLPSGPFEGNLQIPGSFGRGRSGESHKKLLDSIDQTYMNPPDAQGHWGLPVLCLDPVSRQNLP